MFGSTNFIVPIRADGMINATALCKAGEKRLDHYKESPQTKLFLEELSLVTGIRVSNLFEANIGGHNGSWVHRKVGYHLAQWISPFFAVQVSNILDELFITGKVEFGNEKEKTELETLYKDKINKLEKELKTNKVEFHTLSVKYNSSLKTHRYFKFNETGPCFYIIDSGIKCDCNRKKFGISGGNDNTTIDDRLRSHRTIWPMLRVEFIIYINQAILIEKNIKTIFEKQINPNGHEIIEGISTQDIITKIKQLLDVLIIKEYKIVPEETIKKYNDYVNTTLKV